MTRDKILIAYNKNADFHHFDTIKKIFDGCLDTVEYKATDSILKGLQWKTKYYSADFDLYIDRYESLDQWLDDLKDPECDVLRDALAGLIIIDDVDQKQVSILNKKDSPTVHEESFLVWCNTKDEFSQDETDDMNVRIAVDGASLEIIRLHSEEMNEFSDTVGIERVKEIIDTYQWPNMVKESLENSVRTGKAPSDMDNLDSIVQKLNNARSHYQSLDKDNDEADANSFADEIAKEVSERLGL
ncbi:similar to Saccharomyces cerevisiae YFR043C IRC6 Putative protein of unknown function [Maudiozyma saulgeensis]|uniref:Increased recombination centers protein 6 n=1 Tax=Maudiozyma saulgeensis TaxID=1789683 RepID=A0A1X7RB95_9SACH|nr:similar to Saccharomyces cerevisiae YFR043C IRC6 Putative protein of unknown function [Kazachstania saulgeensis]